MPKKVMGAPIRRSGVGSGGGLGNAKVAHVRAGKQEPKPNRVNPKAVSQIGQNLGDHSTDKRRRSSMGEVSEVLYRGKGYQQPVGPSDPVKAVGVGGGRDIHRCGSQGVQGPVAGQPKPQGPDHLSQFGPESPMVGPRKS